MGGGASRSSSSSCLSPAVSVECSEARTGKLGKPLAEVGGASVPSSVYRGSVSNTVSGDGGHRDHKLWGKHVDLACTVAGDIHVHVYMYNIKQTDQLLAIPGQFTTHRYMYCTCASYYMYVYVQCHVVCTCIHQDTWSLWALAPFKLQCSSVFSSSTVYFRHTCTIHVRTMYMYMCAYTYMYVHLSRLPLSMLNCGSLPSKVFITTNRSSASSGYVASTWNMVCMAVDILNISIVCTCTCTYMYTCTHMYV